MEEVINMVDEVEDYAVMFKNFSTDKLKEMSENAGDELERIQANYDHTKNYKMNLDKLIEKRVI